MIMGMRQLKEQKQEIMTFLQNSLPMDNESSETTGSEATSKSADRESTSHRSAGKGDKR